MFKKYPSIENSYREKFINGFVTMYPYLLAATYIITEKVHGANFQIYFEPLMPWRYGKRTAFLQEGEKLYDVHNVVRHYIETFEDIQNWVDHSLNTVRLFGELYGPGIQKGVSYSTAKRIGFYDMMVNDVLLAPAAFRNKNFTGLQQHALPIVATVAELTVALDFSVEFNSLLNPIEGNVCEGVVIAPLGKVYYDKLGRRFCLKKKNEKFMEKVKAAKPIRAADPVITRLNLEFRSYITDNRLQSVFSQHGEIEEPAQIGEYIKLVLGDTKEAFLKDFSEEITALPKSDQRKVFNVGSMIALMLKKHL